MKAIIWSPSYSVGVDILDTQHQNIIKMINLLAAESDSSVGSEVISELLNSLTLYASEHFKTEEGLLAKYNYPDLKDHKSGHHKYRFTVASLCTSTMDHMDSVPEDLLVFLKEWWINHILESDMEYKEFFANHGVQ